ncbi:small ribosomal subunit protein mS31 isoform X2 [Phascolarctos cinereus]|uniref:Small ribosomal subunit protein mS31 n=1 Tax=Phascolarctos cinereus TaxID=38626 RepID=A0A6P5J378_PHACI|nr:28S ribosomal protein S31, mitochondrial isoform X1 [Phascolarctos cinereus]
MFSRVSALGPSRPLLLRLPCIPCGSEAAMETRGLWTLPGPARTEYKIQRCFGTNSVIYSKKDESSVPVAKISDSVPESQDNKKKKAIKNLLNMVRSMKVEVRTSDILQDTKTHTTKTEKEELKNLGRTSRVSQKAVEDSSLESHQSLRPELVAAATAVADSLPFDKLSVKSELLRQLRKHEKDFRAHQGKETVKISDIISDMKITKSPTSRIYTRPDRQIQFDEGLGFLSVNELLEHDSRKRKGLFMGKRLNVFPVAETAPEEASETETSPTLWDVEFAKQLAKVNQQPPQNAFEEMIQWTKEGKLWTFPINNEGGIDDGADFHEHIFLDKYLEDFPKQGPIRHFMELVTCGLSKNPFLTVKEKVEHIEWFRNYFHEKKNILEENNIQFN